MEAELKSIWNYTNISACQTNRRNRDLHLTGTNAINIKVYSINCKHKMQKFTSNYNYNIVLSVYLRFDLVHIQLKIQTRIKL